MVFFLINGMICSTIWTACWVYITLFQKPSQLVYLYKTLLYVRKDTNTHMHTRLCRLKYFNNLVVSFVEIGMQIK